MDHYNYNLDLPFSKTKIFFRELNTQEQLFITKANITFPSDKQNLLEYHLYVLDIVLNCVKNKNDFLKINVIDYVLFLIKLKILSVGSTIDFILNNEDENRAKRKVQMDLKGYMLNLFNASSDLVDEKSIITEKNMSIKMTWPYLNSISDLSYLLLTSKNPYEMFKNSLYQFIEYFEFNGQKISFNTLNKEEKLKLFEKIPLVFITKIEEKLVDAIKKLTEFNLFGMDVFKSYVFNVFNLSFIEHVKLIYSHDLKSLYREIYFLASSNLPPDYVLKLSDFERKTFLTIIQEEIQKSENKNENSSGDPNLKNEFSEAVKKLQVEFSQNQPK